MNNKWNIETVKREALKYNRRIDFKKGCRGAYNFASKNNIMNNICIHMKSNINKTSPIEVANDFTMDAEKVFPSVKKISNNKTIWNYELCKIEALKYNRRIDFRDGSSGAYYYALKNKIMDKISQHMITGVVKIKNKKSITKRDSKINRLLNIASKYDNLKDFRINENSAYCSCKYLGILDKATLHMSKLRYGKIDYTFEECLNNALKSKIMGEFKNHFYNQYNYAKSKDWIDQISLIITLSKLIAKNNQTIGDLQNEIKEYNAKIGNCCKTLEILRDVNLNSSNTIQNIRNLN